MRKWYGNAQDEKDNASIHAIGNGKIIVYEQGPDMQHIFGPPYGTAVAAQLFLDGEYYCESTREPGTGIWTHTLFQNEQKVATMTDFCGPEGQLYRMIDATAPLRFRMCLHPEHSVVHTMKYPGVSGAFLSMLPSGLRVAERIVNHNEFYMLVMTTGQGSVVQEEKPTDKYLLAGVGRSVFLFAGAEEYAGCDASALLTLNTPIEQLLAANRKYWLDFTAKLKPVIDSIPAIPLHDKIVEAIESTAVNIRSQQSDLGGVLAGYYYHLAYVRDEYGVGRGLLAMGLYEQARAILEFYLHTFLRNGAVCNAQATGADGFHVFENDATETPGYIVMQAFDYFDKTGDEAFLVRLLPLLKWCVEQQAGQVHKNMLPFNGDETYIAGGIFPRRSVDQGSAEASMIFIQSERLLNWLDSKKQDSEWVARIRPLVEGVRRDYLKNFIRDGRLMTNNPERFDPTILPKFRRGGCPGPKHTGSFHWIERNAQGIFMCPNCLDDSFGPDMTTYEVKSTSLIPLYLHSDVVSNDVLRGMVEQIAEEYVRTGQFSSRPDAVLTVGYDYGLLLYCAVQLGLDIADSLAEKVLNLLDDTGAWVEYYAHGKPRGCRYRPWESAINLEALLEYAHSKK